MKFLCNEFLVFLKLPYAIYNMEQNKIQDFQCIVVTYFKNKRVFSKQSTLPVQVTTEGQNCADGSKFVLKKLRGVRKQFLFVDGKDILGFVRCLPVYASFTVNSVTWGGAAGRERSLQHVETTPRSRGWCSASRWRGWPASPWCRPSPPPHRTQVRHS